ncbi:mtDNA inheritance, partitioning of the mitochondrial organelle [Serendipita sp. 400]|nr:mtDNA inheritance, partitioning of the mitochondrial organelle [Serendipita sp. 400]
MHEIIYLQMGGLSNYIGTHFWNTQDVYSDEEAAQEVSWSIRHNNRGEQFFHPRVMIFDYRENLGNLRGNSIENEGDDRIGEETPVETWNERLQVLQQPEIPPSRYQAQFDREDRGATRETEPQDEEAMLSEWKSPEPADIRYWSDFNHVNYAPYSIHPLTTWTRRQLEGSQNKSAVTWIEGKDAFTQYDKDTEFMDTALRQLTEECDSFQGFQGLIESKSFGGFNSMISERIAEEHPKRVTIDFVILTATATGQPRMDMAKDSSILSNILTLHSSLHFSSIAVPLLAFEDWHSGGWKRLVPGLKSDSYSMSAIYSGMIESCTWPIRRVKAGREAESLVSHLNSNGKIPFASLEGLLAPLESFKPEEEIDGFILNLSSYERDRHRHTGILASYSVARGIPKTTLSLMQNSREPRLRERHVVLNGVNLPLTPNSSNDTNPYPLPISHPRLFCSPDGAQVLSSVPIYSSLRVEPAVSDVLSTHLNWGERYMKGGDLAVTGLERDEFIEVLESLRAAKEHYCSAAADDSDQEE